MHGCWFLTLEFPRDGTKFCRISTGESFFSLLWNFSRAKSQIQLELASQLKFSGFFFQKIIASQLSSTSPPPSPSALLMAFFQEQPIIISSQYPSSGFSSSSLIIQGSRLTLFIVITVFPKLGSQLPWQGSYLAKLGQLVNEQYISPTWMFYK